ncbi:MAG: hypothetical protein Q8S21_00835 [Candidatus Paracaedibacteraceae bacterium]|nr:hypothetical protein [Candidatus Paracaedibacteraceae bacterium]
MNFKNAIKLKTPRPSRAFQKAMLFHIEFSFNELVQISCSSQKLIKNKIRKSKILLSDMHHVVLCQSFDCDMRDKIMARANATLNYISYYTMAHEDKKNDI